MSKQNNSEKTRHEIANARAYNKEFALAITLYAMLVSVGLVVAQDSFVGRLLLAVVAPTVPGVLILRAIVRSYRRADEYERHQLVLTLAFGFGAAMLTAVILGAALRRSSMYQGMPMVGLCTPSA